MASLIGHLLAMKSKIYFKRSRPSQLCPALLPPLAVPGHASYPSGHSTQAHLMALCMYDVLAGTPNANPWPASPLSPADANNWKIDLLALADRIARNREIAGLHYPSDSWGGVQLATATNLYLNNLTTQDFYTTAIKAAQDEWLKF